MPSIVSQSPSLFSSIVVCLVGIVLGSFANYCVDRLDWNPRFRSPWRRFPKELREKGSLPNRTWADKIPVWGWVRLSRFVFGGADTTSKNKGLKPRQSAERSAPVYAWIPGWESRGFWVRPLLVELLFALLATWRFSFWTSNAAGLTIGPLPTAVVAWSVETLLFWLALCASLVDLDDYVIPDALVLPGSVLGLVACAAFPSLLAPPNGMPILWPLDVGGEHSTLSASAFAANLLSCRGIDASLENVRVLIGTALILGWTFWMFALLDRRFFLRLGVRRACAIFIRRIRRSPLTPIVAVVWLFGALAIAALVLKFTSVSPDNVYTFNSLDSLANSFVGLLVGALLIWIVRLVGGAALGVEAMGFGDVILSGMLGAFIGWQGAVVVFFVAPFFGLVFGLIRRSFNTAREIPYGPFLCLATLLYVVCREQFTVVLAPYFSDPLFALILGGVGIALLAVALVILRLAKTIMRRG